MVRSGAVPKLDEEEQAALARSEERLLLAKDAADVGIHDYDIANNTISWDERVRELWGIGPSATVTLDLFMSGLHPDDRAPTQAALDRALDPQGPGKYRAEYRVINRTDGVTRWIAVTGKTTFVDGRPFRLVGTVQDVTAAKIAEAALKTSEERLRLATDVAGLGIWTWHIAEDRITWENSLLYEVFGLSRTDEPVNSGRFWSEVIHQEDAARLRRALADTLETGARFYFLGRIRRADGRLRWVELTGLMHREREGVGDASDGMIGTASDVTDRIVAEETIGQAAAAAARAEGALRESQGRLQFALKAGRMGTWDRDLATNHLVCSDTCKANYGRGPDDSFTYDDFAASVLEEDRAEWRRVTDEACARAANCELEYRTRWPDGSIHWLHVRACSTTDASGKTVALSGISLMIDEHKRAEERRRLLDALGEATPRPASDPASIMVATTRLLGEYLRATRCAYADVDADGTRFTIRHDWTAAGVASTAGVHALDRFGPRVGAKMRAGEMLVVRDVDRELRSSCEGDVFSELGVGAFICCPLVKEGQLVAMMAVHNATARDWAPAEIALVEEVVERSWAHIERIRAAEDLREQDRRKDEFLATLAHELRNPLAPIRTGLDVLKLTPTGPGAERARAMMDRQLGHMVRLVDDLLDVSRISRGKFELKRQRVQLRAVLDHAVEASRPLIEAARHALTVHAPERAVWLDGDLTRLAQVVSNLLNNSAKYTVDGGHIELSAALEDCQVVIRVADDGMGISAEMLPEVFDLFAQVNRTIARAQGGLGIGLSLVRKLVEMHGGKVEAESGGIGQGSTFTIRLPIMGVDAAHPESEGGGHPRPDRPRLLRKRVLVVDDNVDGAELLATMLDLAGHETRVAYDGPEGLAAARAFTPEVVFLDIGLPGIDGHEVARQLRADPRLAGVVLVALTGWGSEEDKRRTTAAGFDFHLTKPVASAAVEEVLANLPSGSAAHAEGGPPTSPWTRT